MIVCRDCLDIDQPQLQLGRMPIDDPQTLIDPRPDTGYAGSTGLFGWAPVGNPLTNIQCQVGNLTVVTV